MVSVHRFVAHPWLRLLPAVAAAIVLVAIADGAHAEPTPPSKAIGGSSATKPAVTAGSSWKDHTVRSSRGDDSR